MLASGNDYIEAKALTTINFVLDDSPDTVPPATAATRLAPVDGTVVDAVLSTTECAQLVVAAEQSGGFTFWDPSGGEDRRSLRNADTLEFEAVPLCASLWPRLAPFVPAEVSSRRRTRSVSSPSLRAVGWPWV